MFFRNKYNLFFYVDGTVKNSSINKCFIILVMYIKYVKYICYLDLD